MNRVRRLRPWILVCGLALSAMLGTAGSAVAATGSIGGTVTDESHAGIGGLYICATSHDLMGPFGACDFTDGAGDYTIVGLEPGTYVVNFRDESPARNYVTEYYDDRETRAEATRINLGSGEAITGIDAELAEGGQIAGTVTDAVTHQPIEDIWVCAPSVAPSEETSCDRTDSEGKYAVNSLGTGNYRVEFSVDGEPNYIAEYYPGVSNSSEASQVSVTAGSITSGIDVAMHEGIQLTGQLTEAGTGDPVKWILVCALPAGNETERACDSSEPDGTYSIAGLPLGSYVVSFAVDHKEEGLVLHPDGYVRQYYDHKTSFAAANPLGSAVPTVFTGIDAELTLGPEIWPEEIAPPPPNRLTLAPPVLRSPHPHKRTCRRGFHKKKVKGKVRCVRKHRRP
jgi:hypothetical protein